VSTYFHYSECGGGGGEGGEGGEGGDGPEHAHGGAAQEFLV
jgi:hypothetical protein